MHIMEVLTWREPISKQSQWFCSQVPEVWTDQSVCSWQKMLTCPHFLEKVCSLLFKCWGRPTGATTPESRLQLHSISLFYLVSTYRIGLVAPSKSIYCLSSPKHPKHPYAQWMKILWLCAKLKSYYILLLYIRSLCFFNVIRRFLQ